VRPSQESTALPSARSIGKEVAIPSLIQRDAVKPLEIGIEAGRSPIVEPLAAEPSTKTDVRGYVFLAGLLALGLVPVLAYLFLFTPLPAAKPHPTYRIAVLPFKLLGTFENTQGLSMGLTDTVITELSGLKQASIFPTSSVMKYQTEHPDSAAAGRALGADAVLEGTVRRVGNTIRATVQLVRIRDGNVVWAERFDLEPDDSLKFEDDFARRLSVALSRPDLNLTFAP